MDNPTDPSVVHVDDDVIAVKDKYPKARHHFLIMPTERALGNVRDLSVEHVPLLQKMEAVSTKLIAFVACTSLFL